MSLLGLCTLHSRVRNNKALGCLSVWKPPGEAPVSGNWGLGAEEAAWLRLMMSFLAIVDLGAPREECLKFLDCLRKKNWIIFQLAWSSCPMASSSAAGQYGFGVVTLETLTLVFRHRPLVVQSYFKLLLLIRLFPGGRWHLPPVCSPLLCSYFIF